MSTQSTSSGVIAAPAGQSFMDVFLRAAKDTAGGGIGGIGCVLAGQPFDTVKVKMQTFPGVHTTVMSCLRRVVAREGFLGLYAGSAPAFAVNIGENAALFMCYGQCQSAVRLAFGLPAGSELQVHQSACAGSFAAVFSSLIVCPLELIKCRRQAQQEMLERRGHVGVKFMARTPWQITRMVFQEEGVRGFFRGLTSTLAREVPGNFFFFGGYVGARTLLAPGKSVEETGPAALIIAGGMGGVAFWLTTYPADVVKSRQQVNADGGKPVGFVRGFMSILRHEGVCAFYRGVTPALVRAFPANGALFFAYEMTKRLLG